MAIVGVSFILFLNSHYPGGCKILIFFNTQEAGDNEANPLSSPK